jgi:tetratricopeptide (TPR) repeat protein
MRIDLTCPVELWHFKLPTGDFPVCTLQLFNLTDKAVESIQAVFSSFDKAGGMIARQVERIQGLEGQPRSAFELSAAVEGGVQATDFEFTIEKVWFGDGTVWRRDAAQAAEYTPNALKNGRRLEVLRFVAGADAAGYPLDQGALWLCVCGRPNAASESVCRRCSRDKHDIFTKYNEAAIEKVIFARESELEDKAKRAREDAGRISKDREEKAAARRRRRKTILITVFSVVTAAGLFYGVYFQGIPFYKYYMAGVRLESGAYAEARAIYAGLGEYRDSQTLVPECDFRAAGASVQAGTLTSLKVAQDGYDALGAYKNSAALAADMRFRRAGLLTSAGQFEQAIAVYDEIPLYAGVPQKRTETEYLWAKKMMESLDYSAAREKLLSVGNFSDAAALADQCLFLPAVALKEKGDYLAAAALFAQLPDYPGAQTGLQECYYRQGDMLFALENYDEAAEYFLKAGDYLDAWRRATACLYAPAVKAMDAGDYAGAKAMFDKILTYQDAQARSWECTYQMGLARMAAQEYDLAAELFSSIPEHAAAQEALKESYYLPAVSLATSGNEAGALALFEKTPGYKDTDSYILKLQYKAGVLLMNARDYGAAIPLFEELGNYENSAEELLNARYGYAVYQLENKQYADAIQRFSQLGDYLSSRESLDKAYYLYGKDRMDAGEYAAAAPLLAQAGGYSDAAALREQCLYNAAQQADGAGDSAAAAELYALIPDYKDAKAQYARIMYAAGTKSRDSGDYALAARQFLAAGDYLDAPALSNISYDAYYADSYALAKTAMANKQYLAAVNALTGISREALSGKYADIPDMYNEANYLLAEQLYNAKKPFEALVYYRNIPDYKDVTSRKLDRVCYRMLGKWKSTKGVTMEFRDDGTCTLDGRDYYFYAKNYTLETGDSADELAQTYEIVASSRSKLTVRNLKTKILFRMEKVPD